ncbi:hypothetical protein D6C84_09078 [Aureobasidium pullulans]|uniref:Yeast cell wall synthesis Kre9/Knh1-like N-terminal domain-containing protein n=2 Tax=Aureobasidium pullulans TaxID=5580 RepID=A0A4S8WVG7_AURPU|nr:hypothetical protein D6D23_01538 [Aureobasidium pullulans]THW70936.1 hypothetical protein D6D19_07526 [Aureobasidium pullulans]THY56063.1 hypothetical protein D6C99_02955 [Aureobasidium pullulans]THZ75482.1 hypothetical protein D6C84_09078 [Aureobasidium pullulans]
MVIKMRFSTQTLAALLASPLLAFAANANPFTNMNLAATAGKTVDLTWTPTTSGTVSLILRSGANNNLTPGVYVAQGLTNSGSYTWSVPSDITRGTDYALEIVDDTDPDNVNYTGQFVIESTNTVASSTSYIGQSASSSASSVASSISSSASASRSSASGSMSSSASSASGSMSSSASSASGSASSSASSASRSMTSSASSRAASSSSSAAPTSTGGAMASAIPFGLLALGALAL